MTTEAEQPKAFWESRGRDPVLLLHQDDAWLVWQALSDSGCTILARAVAGGDEKALSGRDIDACGLAAVSAVGQLQVVWSELVEGLYQLRCGGPGRAPVPVGDGPQPAIHPQLAAGGTGQVYLVYQQADGCGTYQVMLRKGLEGVWEDPVVVSDTPGNNWSPAVAVCGDGSVAVAWDSYAGGSYDVYLRFLRPDGSWTGTVRLSDGPDFHAHVALAPAGEDQVWVAWNRGTAAWGKDNHPYRAGRIFENNYLHARRFVELRRAGPDRAWPVWPEVQADVLDMKLAGQHHERPRLVVGPDGALHLMLRYNRGEPRGGHRNALRWEAVHMVYDGRGWSEPVLLDGPNGLSTGALSCLPEAEGTALVAAAGEGCPGSPLALATHVYLTRVEGLPAFTGWSAPALPAAVCPVPAAQPRQIRHRVCHGETEYSLYFGDLHRHTEFSFCRTSIDGSLEEVCRYGRDAAAMDFTMSADHDNQEAAPDMWREVMQAADRYHVPGHYAPFFGYEWIGSDRNRRHRNVVSTERVPPPPFAYSEGAGVGGPEDEKNRPVRALWDTLPRESALTLAHHTCCRMSLVWGADGGEDMDAEIEPLVEIFQASRGSSEYIGAPTLYNHFARSGQYAQCFDVESGAVAEALRQGIRMGFVASSDHMSTHQSYACVYASACTREALMAAMKARRTYAASDRILCEFTLGDAFMGEALVPSGQTLVMRSRFVGTGPIRDVVLLRDSEPYRSWTPGGSEFAVELTLPVEECLGHYFYLRMQQTDTNLAWASPIWVDRD